MTHYKNLCSLSYSWCTQRFVKIQHMYIYLLWILFALIVPTSHVHAARPLIVDDARIVDAKSCQLESWMQKNTGSVEFWALPSCNLTGNLELTAGGAMSSGLEDSKNPNLQFQAKTLFKNTEEHGWGIGLTVGGVYRPTINTNRNLTGDLYINIPATFALRSDRLFLNTNIGWLFNHSESSRHHMTMGVGTEFSLSRNLWFIAETFGRHHDRPFYHLGFRFWIVPDRIQIDTTYGNRMAAGNGEQWFTVGLRLISPAFLP